MVIHSSAYPSVPLANIPVHEDILESIEKVIATTPDKKAFIDAFDYSNFITYKDFYDKIRSIATFLQQRGFRKEKACIVLHNCWEYAAFFLGVSMRGGATSGANAMFTDYELEKQFSDSGSTVVLTNEDSLNKVLKAADKCLNVKAIIVVRKKGSRRSFPANVYTWDFVSLTPIEPLEKVEVDLDKDTIILPYSSGTTGSAKGVMLTHRNFGTMINIYKQHNIERILHVVDPNWDVKSEHLLLFLPFYHIFGFGVLVSSMIYGCSSVVLSHFDSEIFLKCIQDFKIRNLFVVPPLLVLMGKSPITAKYDLSSLQVIFSGAAPAGKDLCKEVQKKFPNIKYITQGYGMTEMSLASHFPDLKRKVKFGSVGYLAANNQMKIVDPDTGRICPINVRGEICIKGPTVMLGYFNRENATKETIKDDWLHTGDIGYVDEDGDLFIVDRLKELIKVRGFQVPPAELEDLLLSHPSIKDVAVIGVPDSDAGEVPRAYVVRSDDSLTEQQVFDFVKEKVSYYKQLKGGVVFVDEIPKSAAGKILRRVLRDMAEKSKL